MNRCKYLIIGGGFFGAYLGYLLKKRNRKTSVVIVERGKKLLQRASYNNQARIHNGYHYPRSFMTAFSSHKNFDIFVKEFNECIVNNFEKYYAVGRIHSKITAAQFKVFCNRIGAPIEVAPSHVKSLFNPKLIEEVFLVKEYAFNADILRELMTKKLKQNKIDTLLQHEVIKVNQKKTDKSKQILETEILDLKTKKKFVVQSEYVFICTYSNINTILQNSNIEKIDLKQEMTEMPLIKIPEEMNGKSVTIVCGPFFSVMPFPPRGIYSIHHVRYTPHYHWYDVGTKINNQKHYEIAKKKLKTNFSRIIKDVSRYIPCMEKAKYIDSIFEIKTLLPRNENDDGRPILFKKDVGNVKNLVCIMGGKLDNIYDLEDKLWSVV
tara:strand:+ start:8871 stop:10007 length:1137 start_codon:yes stop_codon:yes gene_type:complete